MFFLSITGFFPDDKQDDSLQYQFDIEGDQLNQDVAQLTESKPLEELPPGELELTRSQVAQLSTLLNIELRNDLEYFIGLRNRP
ncbi:pyocin S6 family toxin immunity protein [Pseudomonas proteolytica]|uniref:pyocin S6 family toxin immunity protein n=1 Tax=Pseudomonas proteolytica TaxID=219574 RepID=UPI001F03CADE|nr:pyocin S6 family toxin immunity protein [Pseudomonas proteolytica]